MPKDDWERSAEADRDPEHLRVLRKWRHSDVTAAACIAIELSIKALIAGEGKRRMRTHHIWQLLPMLSTETAGAVAQIVEPLRRNRLRVEQKHSFDDVGMWRQADTYPDDFPVVSAALLATVVEDAVYASVELAEFTVRTVCMEVEHDPRAKFVANTVQRARQSASQVDVVTGLPALNPTRTSSSTFPQSRSNDP